MYIYVLFAVSYVQYKIIVTRIMSSFIPSECTKV